MSIFIALQADFLVSKEKGTSELHLISMGIL